MLFQRAVYTKYKYLNMLNILSQVAQAFVNESAVLHLHLGYGYYLLCYLLWSRSPAAIKLDILNVIDHETGRLERFNVCDDLFVLKQSENVQVTHAKLEGLVTNRGRDSIHVAAYQGAVGIIIHLVRQIVSTNKSTFVALDQLIFPVKIFYNVLKWSHFRISFRLKSTCKNCLVLITSFHLNGRILRLRRL